MSRDSRLPAAAAVGESDCATGIQLLVSLAGLRNGLRQWMQTNISCQTRITVPRATLLLGLVLKREAVGMSEFGVSMGMSPRNMTVLVDGLEREGLVRRISHPSDRRVTLIELTPTGRQVAEQEIGPAQMAMATLFDDFTSLERGELLLLLDKVAEALRSRGIDVPPREQGPDSTEEDHQS